MPERAVRVERVESAAELRRFVALPFALYRGDPNWVPPLLRERKAFLDPRRNPFFDHAEVALWLARRGREAVGRVASHVDRLHNTTHGENLAMFGFFETVDDDEVAAALLARAVDWARERGAAALRGPLSFSMNHECGLLVEGFDKPPVVMMPYNPPRYAEHLARFGLVKAMDLLAFALRRSEHGSAFGTLPAEFFTIAEVVRRRGEITVRPGDKRHYEEEMRRGFEVFRRAWAANWGFVPPTEAELDRMLRDLEPFVEPSMSFVAEANGRPVGFTLSIRDANEVLARLRGRLFPFAWAKALWKVRRISTVRLMLFGVLPEHRGRGAEVLLLLETFRAALASRYEALELGWILETNEAALRPFLNRGPAYGLRVAHRYRIYEMPLEGRGQGTGTGREQR